VNLEPLRRALSAETVAAADRRRSEVTAECERIVAEAEAGAHELSHEARVEGELTPALRECLDGCLGALQIPAFSGRFRVRYPVFTERATQPPTIELTPDVTRHLDRLFEHERPP